MPSTTQGVLRRYDSLQNWYASHRCLGSPENLKRILGLATCIWEEDFEDIFDPGEFEYHVFKTLTDCFATFAPTDGQSEDEFLGYFRTCFKHDLIDAQREQKSRERKKSCLAYAVWKASLIGT